jgi:hypothetical protein
MTSIFSKALVAVAIFALASGAAQATGFFEQALTDLGNGVKVVAPVVAPPSAPGPTTPSKPPAPMSPCPVTRGSACGSAPNG